MCHIFTFTFTSSTVSLLCWGTNSTGFQFTSGSSSRSRSSSTTPSTVKVRHTSAAPAILSGKAAPGLICGLLCGATWLCLEPRLVASGLEVSVSPDRLFGTHCLRTFEFQNCQFSTVPMFKILRRWHSTARPAQISNLKHTQLARMGVAWQRVL